MENDIEIELDAQTFNALESALAVDQHDYMKVATSLGLARIDVARSVVRLLVSSGGEIDLQSLLDSFKLKPQEIFDAARQLSDEDAMRRVFRRINRLLQRTVVSDIDASTVELNHQAVVGLSEMFRSGQRPAQSVEFESRVVAHRYQINGTLGRGGQSVVYHAKDIALQRFVAVKHINLSGDLTSVAEARREAEFLRDLANPGILPLFDEIVDGSDLFLVFPHCPNDAEHILRKGGLERKTAVEVTKRIARTLAFVHEQGVIHRDIKPNNILFADDATPLLADFGLAFKIAESSEVQFAGTLPYMSPEQYRQEPLDVRTDIYSLGITLYQFLTGRLPFASEGYSRQDRERLKQRVLGEAPLPPTSIDPTISLALEKVCLKAIAKRREERFSSAEAMASALPSGNTRSLESLTSWFKEFVLPGRAYATPESSNLIHYHQATYSESVSIGDRSAQGAALVNMGIAYSTARNLQDATASFENAIAVFSDLGDRAAVADALWSFSRSLQELGDSAQAQSRASEAIDVFEALGSPQAAIIRDQLNLWKS